MCGQSVKQCVAMPSCSYQVCNSRSCLFFTIMPFVSEEPRSIKCTEFVCKAGYFVCYGLKCGGIMFAVSERANSAG
jgi:hypothetical protein